MKDKYETKVETDVRDTQNKGRIKQKEKRNDRKTTRYLDAESESETYTDI
jgi:hypothetical protein